MKTKSEILEYCKKECTKDTKCKGKYLRKSIKDRKYAGIVITRKGEWYCSK